MLFSGPDNPKNCPFPCGDLDPIEPAPQTALDRFSRFCRARKRDQQTDAQTTLPSLYSKRPHLAIRLAIVVMRPDKIRYLLCSACECDAAYCYSCRT